MLWVVGVLAVLLAAVGFTLTRSSVLIRLVEPRLEDALGAEVQVRAASFDGLHAILLHDVRARARGVDGLAGEVLTVDRLRARVDWSSLLTGGFGIREVVFEKPGLRLSQSRADGSLNLAALTPRARSTGPVELPRVRLRGATVEFGEHEGANYDPLASIEVDGELRRSRATPGQYEISLVESPASAALRAPSNPVPIALTGEYDPLAVEGSLTLTNVDLTSWGPGAAPADVRDLWTQLALSGQVEQTEFIYSDAGGVEARFTFDHVGLALPIAADPQADLEANPGPRADPARYMRLSDASGQATLGENGVRAEITGLIEDLPYRVVVKSDTLALDTPFEMRFETTEPFSIAQRPQLLPFAPTIVRERFQSFSGPTAMLEASVIVTRGVPTPEGPAPIRIAGDLILTDGQAAYASFPYTFYKMTGRVRFDDETIHIDEITGVAPSGATLLATGVIAPPVHGAQVAINILIDNVPLDDAFNAAMPASRADLLGTLFNKPEEKRLREQGLLTDEFSLGGIGSLDIQVRRPLGDDSLWDWNATLSLPRAGLIVEQFPYPAIAENAVVQVWEDRAEVVIPTLRGLGGGDGDLKAWITLEQGGKSVFSPILLVRALGTPIDERLLHAIPNGDGNEESVSPAQILRELGLQGTVDTIARVLPRDNTDDLGFDVSLEFAGLSAAPRSEEDSAPLVRDLRGRLQISENGVTIPGMEGRLSDGGFILAGELGYSDESGGVTDLTLEANGLRVDEPFERLFAPFTLEGAAMIRRGIDSVEAIGAVDASVRITRDRGADSFAATANLTAFDQLSFNALGARASLEDSTGGLTIAVDADGERIARFDGFSAGIRFDGSEMARVALRGDLDLRALTASDDPADSLHASGRTLEAGATLAWPSAVTDAILNRAAPSRSEQIRAFLDRWGAQLKADLTAVIQSTPNGFKIGEVSAAPTGITFNRDGIENTFKIESGRLVYRDDRVTIDTLALTSDKVSATISGEAVVRPSPSVELSIAGAIAPFDAQTRALLPENLRRTLDDSRLNATRIDIDQAQISVSTETILDATMRYDGLALDLGGASIADAHGSLEIRIDTADPRPLDATLAFDHARVQRIELERGVARVVAVDEGATLLVPSFEAAAYGGRVFGVARLERSGGSIMGGKTTSDSPLRYEVEGALSGLSFDDLRSDLRVDERSSEATRERTPSRGGVVDATISVAGVVGRPDDRVGQGAVRIWGGELLRLPLAGPLIELSNLQLPTSEQIDFAQAKFYIEGGVVSFEELGVSSQSVSLDGQGTLLWPSLELDLSVTSRGVRRAPILSDVIEAFRNELIVSRVTGTLAQPEFTVQTLPSTQRFLDSIFGSRNDRPEPARPAARPIGDAASPPVDR